MNHGEDDELTEKRPVGSGVHGGESCHAAGGNGSEERVRKGGALAVCRCPRQHQKSCAAEDQDEETQDDDAERRQPSQATDDVHKTASLYNKEIPDKFSCLTSRMCLPAFLKSTSLLYAPFLVYARKNTEAQESRIILK